MNRTIAILQLHDDNSEQHIIDIYNSIISNVDITNIYIFTAKPNQNFNVALNQKQIQNVNWPESCDTEPKIRNWINQYFKTQQLSGFLHVIDDDIFIYNNPNDFVNKIEKMMKSLDYTVWFSTVTDKCNYVYSKYYPRLSIILDKLDLPLLDVGEKLNYTSHSNTHWIIYDFDKISEHLLKFDEDFIVPMFWIIEFLARRRNTRANKQLFYMNQYLTIDAEQNVFKLLDIKEKEFSQSQMQIDDAKFKEKNINYAPDNNIDMILEQTYDKIRSI